MFIILNNPFFFQLYELGDESDRKVFLDDLFTFMQKRGKKTIHICVIHHKLIYIYTDKAHNTNARKLNLSCEKILCFFACNLVNFLTKTHHKLINAFGK